MINRLFLMTTMLMVYCISTYAQGCSDAGICTISSFKPGSLYYSDSMHTSVKVGINTGSADHNISVLATYVEYERSVSSNLDINARLTSLSQSGNGISVWGLSDIYLTVKFRVWDQLSLILGAKLPLTDGNRLHNQLPLPMDYQSSLGTVDGIAGLGYKMGSLQLMAGYQHPVIQNDNKYERRLYEEGNILGTFQSTSKYTRNSDILFRASYTVPLVGKLTITPSVLAVYHTDNDTWQSGPDKVHIIDGSKGMTLNGNLYVDFPFLMRHAVQASVGFPLAVRDVRPDGLTRGFVAGIEYKYTF